MQHITTPAMTNAGMNTMKAENPAPAMAATAKTTVMQAKVQQQHDLTAFSVISVAASTYALSS